MQKWLENNDLGYLNRLEGQNSNDYHHSNSRSPVNSDHSVLTEKRLAK